MNLKEFISNLSKQGVELWVEGDRLRYRGSQEVLTPELFDTIKQQKAEIIDCLRENRVKTNQDKEYQTLSYGQKALWFVYELEPNSSAYNIHSALSLNLDTDISALSNAFISLVKRHSILRATYTTVNGKPVQKIQPIQPSYLQAIDASTWTQEDLERYREEEADKPFDLINGPIFRANILTFFSERNPILLITIHHIISDFWSLEIILEELGVLYFAHKNGIQVNLPPLEKTFQDYVQWENKKLKSRDGEKLWNYWKQKLSGEVPILDLPTDKPRPPIQTYEGDNLYFDLGEELMQKLGGLARTQGVTLYTLILSAFQVLLFRYSSQEDILIGSPLLARDLAEFENLVGYFINPIVIRANLSGSPTFLELLQRTKNLLLEGLEHKDFPFPLLVEKLQPVRDSSRSPFFQVAFSWGKARKDQISLEKKLQRNTLMAELLTFEQRGADFDLVLMVAETGRKLQTIWVYNTNLFERNTIERMTNHFQILLEGIVDNPDEKISFLPILRNDEKQQILVEWNNTEADYPQDKCIHQLFEEQVARTPDAVAVVYEEQHLTYKELNKRANQLAHYLVKLGVKPDDLVGISVERSLDMVVGLLGILKSGGAYVPIDHHYPQERIEYMLSDSQTKILLTQIALINQLPEYGGEVIDLEGDWTKIGGESSENLTIEVNLSNLVYVIYTSGSTGKPKGVLIKHQGLLNLIYWHLQEFKVTNADKATQLAGTGFDAAVWEIWPYLTVGASLYLVPPFIVSSQLELQKWLISKKISITFVPTPLAELLVELDWSENASLRMILTGGDKLHQPKSFAFPFELVNNYGPTENTVVSTSAIVKSKYDYSLSPTIGRPIFNNQVYILDSSLQPVPISAPGELHIGGDSLAKGYLNRPELTAEKFIANPFSNQPDARLYKTGDLCRYLPDGNIEYLGRIDHQVKIRGFRIELGEIESTLSTNPEVKETVVIAREDKLGDKRLVAYLVSNLTAENLENQTELTTILRQYLGEQLPEYMIPSAFVWLEQLPLTPNGKVDRKALPAPDLTNIMLGNEFVPPRTETEEILAKIWKEVLGLEKVGVHDNFFDLGGHSLLATQVVSRVKALFTTTKFSLRNIFTSPTVEEIAEFIDIEQLESTDDDILAEALAEIDL